MDVLWSVGAPLAGVGAIVIVAWWAVGVRDRLDTLRRDHEREADELGRVNETQVAHGNRFWDLEQALEDLVTRQWRLEGALAHLGLQSCHVCGRWGIPSSEMCRVTPDRAACAQCLPAVLDPSETAMGKEDLERVAEWLGNPKRPMELVDRCIAARPGLWRAIAQVEEDRRYQRLSEQAGTS